MALVPFILGNNYQIVAQFGDDPKKARGEIEYYTQGACAVLAGRIYTLTGWPVVSLNNPEDGHFLSVHYLNKRPDGAYVDAHGVCGTGLYGLIALRHNVAKPQWVISKGSYSLDGEIEDVEEERVAAFLASPWMMAVIPDDARK